MPHLKLPSFCIIAASLIAVLAPSATVRSAEPDDEQFFETQVRPLLTERCFKCHGDDKQKGGLRLNGLRTLLTGGESGPAIVPGHPEQSLLIEAINYESFEMPPDGKLSDDEIAILSTWVTKGAPWPGADRDLAPRLPVEKFSDDDRQFWSFQPLQHAEPPRVDDDDHWCRNDIDRFILQRLQQADLTPAGQAAPSALIRRLSQTLVGLPPTPAQVDEFVSEPTDANYARSVDELLDSPRYGEHMAHYWLDLVRYADSDGYKADDFRPDAWRYRDYVIQAFNDDKPYDRFVLEQLAGDEIAPDDPQALAATGFFRQGIYEYNQRDAYTQWRDMLNDITDTTADVFLGLGMGCARCHDHKFDPILQKDYFRLQAFFAGLSLRDDVPFATPAERDTHAKQLREWEEQTAVIREQIDALEAQKRKNAAHQAIIKFPEEIQAIMFKAAGDRSPYERQIAHLVELQIIGGDAKLETKFTKDEQQRWDELQKQLAQFDQLRPQPLPALRCVTDIDRVVPAVFIPGKERLGEVEPGFLSVLDDGPAAISELPSAPQSSGRRTALARWLTSPDHPLTARVIVNRVWQHHFGTGLVATPSDFGRLGEPASHPELLDWLATRFIESGWSLKWLHRQILTSATWRQSALRETPTVARKVDPGNRLLWRQNIRRLEAEQIRDSLLAVTGELTIHAGQPPTDPATSMQRTIYTKLLRNQRHEVLTAFDLPDRITSTGERNVTTTPSQSLLMINSPWMIDRARTFAQRLQREIPGSDDSLVRQACLLAFSREASEAERSRAVNFLSSQPGGDEGAETTRTATMPGTGSAALVLTDADAAPPRMPQFDVLPKDEYSISAVVRLNSLYPDAKVRTIVSQWDSDTTHRGWSLGVTSAKSRYRSGNLILQIVGDNADGQLTYEVIPSGIHLELDRTYLISFAVQPRETSLAGIRFVVRDLSKVESPDEVASVPHQVVSGFHNDRALVVGGRDGTLLHRWDGLIDDLYLTAAARDVNGLRTVEAGEDPHVVGYWAFDDPHQHLADESGQGHDLSATQMVPSSALDRLVDFCHVLLNSNEFLYID